MEGEAQPNTTKRKLLMKVINIGESAVGKTSFMHRIARGVEYQYRYSTIGVDFLTKEYHDDIRHFSIHFWDTAGQERFFSLGNAFFRGTDLCLITFSLQDRHSFGKVPFWYHEFRSHQLDTPIILLGNKVDRKDPQVQKEEVEELMKSLGDEHLLKYFEVSAQNGVGVACMEAYLVDQLTLLQYQQNAVSIPVPADNTRRNRGCV
eukprot:TRINITY_DN115569_c0_g1_i1.p1 TRINITY_DN115569_c0_g1~~TRINITY_DN115569_c0_g1_i1.p1  ORF type:complete len:205 (+),score=1.15 TRINITY_DN115569_c0_g1_i1:28-642(+)